MLAQRGARRALLRVCADPDNLPYLAAPTAAASRTASRGCVADELQRDAASTRGSRSAAASCARRSAPDLCDVFIGVPAGFERVLTTRPYYRSSYVFVNRADAPRRSTRSTTRACATLRIGVQLIGDDLAATPPGARARARAARSSTSSATRSTATGSAARADQSPTSPPAGSTPRCVWGPQAGYFADAQRRAAARLRARVPPAGLRPAVRVRDRDGRAPAATARCATRSTRALERRARRDRRASSTPTTCRAAADGAAADAARARRGAAAMKRASLRRARARRVRARRLLSREARVPAAGRGLAADPARSGELQPGGGRPLQPGLAADADARTRRRERLRRRTRASACSAGTTAAAATPAAAAATWARR